MFFDVSNYVRNCLVCQTSKVEQKLPSGLLGLRVIEYPWCIVAADVMEFPRSKSGMSYLLVFQDLFTKWIEVRPLRQANGPKIAEAFNDLILTRWGAPRYLLTDNGTEFVNKTIANLAKEYNIVHTTTPPYRAQADPVERVNRVLKTMVICFLSQDHREWDMHVNDFRFAFNTAVHTATKFSPAFLNLGRDLLIKNSFQQELEKEILIDSLNPIDWNNRLSRVKLIRSWIAENLIAANNKQAKYYNQRHRSLTFNLNDKVMYRNRVLSKGSANFSSKLAKKFRGPCTISRILSPLVYEIIDPQGKTIKTSITDIKPYHSA